MFILIFLVTNRMHPLHGAQWTCYFLWTLTTMLMRSYCWNTNVFEMNFYILFVGSFTTVMLITQGSLTVRTVYVARQDYYYLVYLEMMFDWVLFVCL